MNITPLIKLTQKIQETNTTTVSAGPLNLTETSGYLIPGHFTNSFLWYDSTDKSGTSLLFDNGYFYTFLLDLDFTTADSAAAMDALQSTTPTPTPSQTPLPSQNPTSSPMQTQSLDPTSTPVPTQTIPELSSPVILPLIFSVFSVAAIVRYRKATIMSK